MKKCIFCERRGIETELIPGKKEINLIAKNGTRVKLRDVPYNYCPECKEDFFTEEMVQSFEKTIVSQ